MKHNKNIKNNIVLFISMLLSLLVIACSKTIPTSTTTSMGESSQPILNTIKQSENDKREYKIIRLENELELVLVSDISLERSAVALAVKAGSYDETNGFWGQAHFLEHMLFLGTEKYPEEGSFNTFISSNGGINNAYTDMDHTNYMASIKNNAYEELLDRFSDYFKKPLLSAKYIEKERNAVHSEWSMKGVYDGVILGHLNGLTLNPKHPVSNFTWGNLSSLKDQNGQTLQETTVNFFDKFYQANGMKIALVSNRSIGELEQVAKKYFSDISNEKTQKYDIKTPVITHDQIKKLIRYKPKKELKKIQLKFVISDNSSQFLSKPNYYVSYLLNSEMPGTLTDALKGKGLVESLYAWADPSAFGNAGEFVIDIDLTEQGLSQRDTIINTVFNYLALIEKEGISKKYYQEIQQSLKNSFDFQSKYSEYNYAANLAAKMHDVPKNYLLSSEYEFTVFNKEHIKQLLAQLVVDNVRVFYIDKYQKTDKVMKYFEAAYKIDDILPEQLTKWQVSKSGVELALPQLNSLLPTNFSLVNKNLQKVPISFTTQSGSVLHVKHSDKFSVPKGSISVNLNTTVGSKSAKEQALLLLLNKAATEELSQLTTQAYSAGMSLTLNTVQGLTLVSSGFSQKQFELQFKALSALRAFTLTDSKFNQFKRALKISLDNKKENALYSQAFDYYRTFLVNGDFPTQDLLKEIRHITLSDFNLFSEQFFSSIRLNAFTYGNFKNRQSVSFIHSLEQLFKVTTNKNSPIYLTKNYEFKNGEQVNIKINAEQNDVALIDAKWQKHTVERQATGLLLTKIISPALFKQIRTEEQLGYSVGFYSDITEQQISYVWYVQTPVKSPQDMLERFDAFKSKFGLEISTIDEVRLNQYREAVLVSLTQKAKNIYQEQTEYLSDWRQGNLTFDSKAKLINAIKEVTVEDIQHIYNQLINDNKMARIMVQIKGKNFVKNTFIELDEMVTE